MRGRTVCRVALVLALTAVSSGVQVAQGQPVTPPAKEKCEHPYPCETDADLAGTFELGEVVYERLEVPLDWDDPEGPTIELEGWIGMPDVPEGVRVPVALVSTAYLGSCYWVAVKAGEGCDPTPDADDWWTDPAHPWAEHQWGVAPVELVEHGIATAFFATRGAGTSGGCLNHFGDQDRRDQEFLVQSLAGRDWSNGRVAAGGTSYAAAIAWAGAVLAPPALKTIVTTGIVSDLYTQMHTPQGAHHVNAGATFWAAWDTSETLVPAANNERMVDYVPEHGARVCDDLVEMQRATSTSAVADDRNATFWNERRSIDRFDEVTAAVLLGQGFLDQYGQAFQDAEVWGALTSAPKRRIVGQWGHRWPGFDVGLDREWRDVLLPWLGYWLKGECNDRPCHFDPDHPHRSIPDGLGTVDYADSTSTWRTSSAWPPAEAREEVLFLGDSGLSGELSEGARSFRSVPLPVNEFEGTHDLGDDSWVTAVWPSLCGPGGADPYGLTDVIGPVGADNVADPLGLAYLSAPLGDDVVIAGNPFAYLRLSSDLPGGLVGVHMVSLTEDFDCTDSADLEFITSGTADLRFHEGNEDFLAKPFPVSDATSVRIDLFDIAQHLTKGSRLAVVVSYGEAFISDSAYGKTSQPYYPNITVHGGGEAIASQLVLPIIAGSMGGGAPTIEYPPRPFAP